MIVAVGAGFVLLVVLAAWILWPLFTVAPQRQLDEGVDTLRARQEMLAARWEDLESDHMSALVGEDEYAASQRALKEDIKSLQKEARQAILVVALMGTLVLPAHAQLPAEVGGSIEGRIVSQDPSFTVPSNLEVELHPVRKGKAGPTFETRIDTQGHFAMDGLLLHKDIRYWFSVHVQGSTYYSNVVTLTNEDPKAQVEIPVFPVADAPGKLHIVLDHELMKVETRSADILELVAVEQPGTDGYTGGVDGGVLIPLPSGFYALEDEVAGSSPIVEVPGKGALIQGPLPPGKTAVAFDYRLPISGDRVDVVRRWGLPVDRYGLFLNQSSVTIDAPGMVDEGPKVVDDKNYHVYAVLNAGPDHPVLFSLANFPKAPRDWRPWYGVSFGGVLLLGLAVAWRRNASPGVRASRPLGDAASSGRDARTPEDASPEFSAL